MAVAEDAGCNSEQTCYAHDITVITESQKRAQRACSPQAIRRKQLV